MRLLRSAAAVAGLALLGSFAATMAAQQKVPTNNGTPVAPNGLSVGVPPDKPVEYRTAEGVCQ